MSPQRLEELCLIVKSGKDTPGFVARLSLEEFNAVGFFRFYRKCGGVLNNESKC